MNPKKNFFLFNCLSQSIFSNCYLKSCFLVRFIDYTTMTIRNGSEYLTEHKKLIPIKHFSQTADFQFWSLVFLLTKSFFQLCSWNMTFLSHKCKFFIDYYRYYHWMWVSCRYNFWIDVFLSFYSCQSQRLSNKSSHFSIRVNVILQRRKSILLSS